MASCIPIFSLLLASLLSGSLAVAAQAPTTVRFGLSSGTQLAEFKDGRYQGLGVEMSRQIARSVDPDITVKFLIAPHKRLTNELLSNHIDFTYLPANEALLNQAIQITQVAELNISLWSLQSKPITSLEQLGGLLLAVPANYRNSPVFSRSQLIPQPDTQNLLKMLQAGRADGILASGITFRYQTERLGLDPDDFYQLPLKKVAWYLWTHKESPASQAIDRWAQATDKINPAKSFAVELQFKRSAIAQDPVGKVLTTPH